MSLYLPCEHCGKEWQVDVIWFIIDIDFLSKNLTATSSLAIYSFCEDCAKDTRVMWHWPHILNSFLLADLSRKQFADSEVYQSGLIYSNTKPTPRPKPDTEAHEYWRGLNLIGSFYDDEDMSLDEIQLKLNEIQPCPMPLDFRIKPYP